MSSAVISAASALDGITLQGDAALLYAVGWLGVTLVVAIFVRRYSISQTGRKDERAALSKDTQDFIDTLNARYREMDETFHSRMRALQDQLQDMTLQYSTAVATNGRLESQVSVLEAKNEALERELAAVRSEMSRLAGE